MTTVVTNTNNTHEPLSSDLQVGSVNHHKQVRKKYNLSCIASGLFSAAFLSAIPVIVALGCTLAQTHGVGQAAEITPVEVVK